MTRLLLGVGNILMGDDGVGVHVARALKAEENPPFLAIEDGGTGGISLIDLIEPFDEILVVDAANMNGQGGGCPAGRIAEIRPAMLCARRAWSGHDHGLVDALKLLEIFPSKHVVRILGVQPASVSPSLTLSPELQAAFPAILTTVREEAVRPWNMKGVTCHD
ncbi:hydrogenase maturation protease [bacterium]|nr:hydrogenase maturation protease [bacterium]